MDRFTQKVRQLRSYIREENSDFKRLPIADVELLLLQFYQLKCYIRVRQRSVGPLERLLEVTIGERDAKKT